MAGIIARANKNTGPQPDMSRVEAAVRTLGRKAHVPSPRVSRTGMIPEDASRRSYTTKEIIPIRSLAGFHHADFKS